MLPEKVAELLSSTGPIGLLHRCSRQPNILVMGGELRGKSAKVLSVANCGMGAAVDIGVIRDHVIGFQRYLWCGCDLSDRIYLQRQWAPFGSLRRSELVRRALGDFVGEFTLGAAA
jgi:hypothetical protein